MHDAQLCTVAPLQYGVMPNLGLYSKPDGPVRQLERAAAAGPHRRGPRVAKKRPSRWPSSTWSTWPTRSDEAGADAIDWDTTGASGDPEFLAAPQGRPPSSARSTLTLASSSAWPASSCSACTASSSTRACAWPACGPKTSCCSPRRPAPPCSDRSSTSTPARPAPGTSPGRSRSSSRAWTWPTIPVHMNAGMGVGGVPMFVHPPADAVCRAAKSCVDILHARRLLGRLGRSARHAQCARAGGGHGRNASSRRSGGSHADDPRNAFERGQRVRRRQARRDAVRPVRPRRHDRRAQRVRLWPHPQLRDPPAARRPIRSRPSSTSRACSTCPSTASSASRNVRRRSPAACASEGHRWEGGDDSQSTRRRAQERRLSARGVHRRRAARDPPRDARGARPHRRVRRRRRGARDLRPGGRRHRPRASRRLPAGPPGRRRGRRRALHGRALRARPGQRCGPRRRPRRLYQLRRGHPGRRSLHRRAARVAQGRRGRLHAPDRRPARDRRGRASPRGARRAARTRRPCTMPRRSSRTPPSTPPSARCRASARSR